MKKGIRRTTIEFDRLVANRVDNQDGVRESVNAEVVLDGQSLEVELPTGGRWGCDLEDLLRFLADG